MASSRSAHPCADRPADGICQGIVKSTNKKCTARARPGSRVCGHHKNQDPDAVGASSSGSMDRPADDDGICEGIVKSTNQKCTARARPGSKVCGHHKNQDPDAVGASSSGGADHHQPADGGIYCQGIVKSTNKKCTARARPGSKVCGNHKNQDPDAVGASSSGRMDRPADDDGSCQGIVKSTNQKCTARARPGSKVCGHHKNQEPNAVGASSSGGTRSASSSSPKMGKSATSVPLDQFWKHEFSKDVKQKCQDFLKTECISEFREKGDGGELGVGDMNELILKRRAVAGLAKHSENTPNFRSDRDLLISVSPFNLLTEDELKQVLELLGLNTNTRSANKGSMLRDLVLHLADLDGLPAAVEKVQLSREGEEFRKKLFDDVCLDGQGGLVCLLNPALATDVTNELLQWAKEDTYILTQDSVEIMQGRQRWLKGMDEVLESLAEGNGMPEGSMDSARAAVKRVKTQVQWELGTATDCGGLLHDALVSHHAEQVLRFYKQDTAPGCNGGDGISSERQVNFFAGKTLDKSVLRAPQREALDAVSRWAERSAGLLNGEFATKMRKLLGKQVDALIKLKDEFCRQVRISYLVQSPHRQSPTDKPVLSALEDLKNVTSELREYCLHESKPAILVLPTGLGKTGVITGLPFILPLQHSRRVLVVAPNTTIRGKVSGEGGVSGEGLMKDFADPKKSFYVERKLLPSGSDLPKATTLSNSADPEKLKHYDVVVTNFHQLVSKKLFNYPRDFFDAVIVDEGHHQEAQTYRLIREYFACAHMVTLTATPWRGDRQELVGDIIYTFPIKKAIENKYIKDIVYCPVPVKSCQLINTTTGQPHLELKSHEEVCQESDRQYVRVLAQEDTTIRLSIMKTAMDRLRWLRNISGNPSPPRHQAIVQASDVLDAEKICEEWMDHPDNKGKGSFNIDYVASKDGEHPKEWHRPNNGAKEALYQGNLDIIVHVGKLGEGFDHKNLSVAVIFCPLGCMSRYSQFVGRAIRRLPDNESSPALKPQEQVAYVISHPALGCHKPWHVYCQERQDEKEELAGKGKGRAGVPLAVRDHVVETGLPGGSKMYWFRDSIESSASSPIKPPLTPQKAHPASASGRSKRP